MKKAKRHLISLLNKNVVANVQFVTVVQGGFFAMSAVVLAFCLWNLTRCELTAVQTVIGTVLSSLASLAFIGIGLVLPNMAALRGERPE